MSQLLYSPFELRLGDGGILRGEIRATDAPGRRPVILIAHGFKGFKDWGFIPYTAEQLAWSGFCSVTFNFSRNGVAEKDYDELAKFGYNTYSSEQGDLVQLITAIVGGALPFADKIERSKIGILGHSRGGGNALIFAAEHPLVRAIVTWNGIARTNLFDAAFEEKARTEGVAYTLNTRTQQEMPVRREFFEDLDANAERFDIRARLQNLRASVLLIQGGNDSPAMLEGFEQLREAAPQLQSLLLPGTGHAFDSVHPFAGTNEALESALEATITFFRDKL